MLTVKFKYKIHNEQEWLSVKMKDTDYFDLEPDEVPDIWSCPKSSRLLDYIEADRDDVNVIKVEITDISKREKLTFIQKFWNHQNNYILERCVRRFS